MGWNSWNHFAEKVSDRTIREAADALVNTGMRDAGYVYVNIDDGWQGTRDAAGNIRSNDKFPDMKALAGYVHARGLKLGIYSSPGPKPAPGMRARSTTCSRTQRPTRRGTSTTSSTTCALTRKP